MAISFSVSALKDNNVDKMLSVPTREQAIIVGPAGYYPERITLFEGEKIHIFLTSATEENSCMIVAEKKLFLSARKGEIREGELYFDKPGSFKFYCPTGKIEGKITVLKKPMTLKEERSIASKKASVEIWSPKDE